MRDIVIERCKKVLDHWNVVLCHMICDSSLVHIILESIFSTSYVSDVVYNQIREMIFND